MQGEYEVAGSDIVEVTAPIAGNIENAPQPAAPAKDAA